MSFACQAHQAPHSLNWANSSYKELLKEYAQARQLVISMLLDFGVPSEVANRPEKLPVNYLQEMDAVSLQGLRSLVNHLTEIKQQLELRIQQIKAISQGLFDLTKT